MRMQTAALLLSLLILSPALAQPAGRGYPAKIAGAHEEIYKTIGDVKLKMYLFTPEGHTAGDARPAIVFFFGGGWRSGSPGQFAEHCRYLAERGMVAMAADYRVASRHKVKATACVADAKSAVRWIRQNAKRLGVDPNKIVAAGGSAGGHLAACTGVVPGFETEGEDASISSVPNALALFNPAVLLAPIEGGPEQLVRRNVDLADRMGIAPERISPAHHVQAGAPPTIIFHGKQDTTVPYATVELFAAAMKKAGNQCRLVGYAGAGHGFFNHGRGGGKAYHQTVEELDVFLVGLGYLDKRAASPVE